MSRPFDLVVDASVGVKWYVPENDSDMAEKVRDVSIRLCVPALFFTEVAQTIWKKARVRQELSADEARDIVRNLIDEPLITFSTDSLLETAFEIAMGTGRSVYDSVYVALAEELHCQLVTADERLYDGLRGTPFEDTVCLLSELPRLFPADPDSGMMEADPEPA